MKKLIIDKTIFVLRLIISIYAVPSFLNNWIVSFSPTHAKASIKKCKKTSFFEDNLFVAETSAELFALTMFVRYLHERIWKRSYGKINNSLWNWNFFVEQKS